MSTAAGHQAMGDIKADLKVSDAITIPAAELSWSFARSGGPGGQNVNKVESKVDLRWTPAGSRALAGLDETTRTWLLSRLAPRLTLDGELVVTSTLHRDQLRNREDAATKLVGVVRAALIRPKTRRATRPSKRANQRRIAAKKHRGEIKKGRRGDGD
jgi:ribosome-associated protein